MGKHSTAFKLNTFINENFIIRYYPNADDRHTNYLIGKMKLYDILNDYRTRRNILKKIQQSNKEKIEIRFRGGKMLQFVQR